MVGPVTSITCLNDNAMSFCPSELNNDHLEFCSWLLFHPMTSEDGRAAVFRLGFHFFKDTWPGGQEGSASFPVSWQSVRVSKCAVLMGARV